MAVVVVVRSRRGPDEGVVIHLNEHLGALHFALNWQHRHPNDRLSILTDRMEPVAALDNG